MKAHELLSSPEKWTQHTSARTLGLFPTDPSDPLASCWCMIGAIVKCYPEISTHNLNINRIEKHLTNSITDWNDAPERTYEEMIAVLKELDI